MLVLASNSPRRKDLLKVIGLDFVTSAPEVDERVIENEHPEAYTRRVARAKVEAVYAQSGLTWKTGDLILAADTVVLDEGPERKLNGIPGFTILGKPVDLDQAEKMLLRLRGRPHQVCSAIAVQDPVSQTVSEAVEYSHVRMRNFTMDEMHEYIASGDPVDKAGSYAIQHPGFRPVESVTGCYPNVMGLPVCLVIQLVKTVYHSSTLAKLPACHKSEVPCWIYLDAIRQGENG